VYSNLAPGAYTFMVQACNNNGIWSLVPTRVLVVKQPFFYQTWWFVVLCMVAGVALLVLVFRLRTMRLRAKAAQLSQLVSERTTELQASNAALQSSNQQIQHQLTLLDEHAHEIESFNLQLHEQNLRLEESNHDLSMANIEILRQQDILETQAAEIELANSELQEHNVRLEQLNREKNEFLGIASHDLKNPLAAIQMTAALLHDYYDRWDKDSMIARLGSIITSSKRMSAIISNLLDINAIESGKFNLIPELLDAVSITRTLVGEYQERAAAKQITLQFSSAEPSVTAFLDTNSTMEVLDNLVSNAVKYSPHGTTVFVYVESVAVIADASVALISVRDEGPGISNEDKSKMFGKFARLSAKPTGGESSTGLGLSIVKRLVEAMNGRIWCESTLGEGSTFVLALPTAPEQCVPDTIHTQLSS
jgi:signal transduction histidine kinase